MELITFLQIIILFFSLAKIHQEVKVVTEYSMIHRAPFYTKLRPFCGLDIYFKREEVLEGMEDHAHEPELAYGYVVKHGCPVNPIFYKKDPNPVFSQMKDYHVPLDQKETGDHLFLDITIP